MLREKQVRAINVVALESEALWADGVCSKNKLRQATTGPRLCTMRSLGLPMTPPNCLAIPSLTLKHATWAAWASVLMRATGQAGLFIGSPIALFQGQVLRGIAWILDPFPDCVALPFS
jgi:hypothetical protein